MQFCTTRSNKVETSYSKAILRCLPEGGGLYVPSTVPDMRQFFMHMDEKTTYPELVAALSPLLFEGELNPLSASRISLSAFNFEPDFIQLDENFSLLALYNGPTGVYKDFGLAYLAAVLEELQKKDSQIMIVSAVRGRTGASIARTFQGRKGITAVLLYPSGQIAGLDPASYISNGGNIIPIQIRGSFSDCQRLVKNLIKDRPFAERHRLTSADTINPGRLLPQAFYYIYAFIKIKKSLTGNFMFSVPSGNFGNFVSGLYAWKFGMPVNGFIAAMNENNAFDRFFKGNDLEAKTHVSTCSPAMDVVKPSNYERLLSFYEEAPAVMRNMVYPAAIDDASARASMKYALEKYKLLLDPHSAVALAAARKLFSETGDCGAHTVILATGHPAREADTVKLATGQSVPISEKFKELNRESSPIALIDPQLLALESAIASCF